MKFFLILKSHSVTATPTQHSNNSQNAMQQNNSEEINKIVSKIKFDKILVCDKKTCGMKNNGKNFNKYKICRHDDIEDIRSKPSNCTLINNFHFSIYHFTVQEIFPHALLLNQFNGTILVGQELYNVNDTYLIIFRNETLTLNGKLFSFSETSFLKPLPAVLQPRFANPHFVKNLTIELNKEMHLNNTKSIRLNTKKADDILYII
uniref:Uncharacterized protein n=1 Tax=Glossina austeni TaxID=7395 RepID=A0A1A9V8F0_GLOAU